MVFGLVLFARNPYVFARPQFWHEDFFVFFADARNLGPAALTTPYAGYLHTYQRLVALLVNMLPMEHTPLLYTGAALAGWIAAGHICLTSTVFPNLRWALFAALAMVCVPHNGEVFLILTNIQWVFAAALILVLAEPATQTASPWRLAFAALAGLTGPFSVMLAPVALFRAISFRRQNRRLEPIAIVTLCCALVQLGSVVTSSARLGQTVGADYNLLALCVSIGVFPELFGTYSVFPSDLPLRLTGTLAGIAGLLLICTPRITGCNPRRLLIAGGGLVLVAGLAHCVFTHGGAPRALGAGGRYLFVPFTIFTWSLIATWSHFERRWSALLLPAALLFVIALHSAKNPQAPQHPAPPWPDICKSVRHGDTVHFQIAPFQTWVELSPLKSD